MRKNDESLPPAPGSDFFTNAGYGDSGGPDFITIDDQLVLTAITVTGDTACRSTNMDYRLDTPQAQSFFSWVNATYGTSIPVSSC